MHRPIRELHIKAINIFPALICMGEMECAALSEMHWPLSELHIKATNNFPAHRRMRGRECAALSEMHWPLGSVLPGFLPSFPSQICGSVVTFVTFSGDKQCDASHVSHFWEECDALAHENIVFNSWHFLSHPSRKTSHPLVQKFFELEEMWRFGWDWNMFFSCRLRFVTYLGSVKREGHFG